MAHGPGAAPPRARRFGRTLKRMARIRVLAATGFAGLAVAAPAGAVTIGAAPSAALHRGSVVSVTTAASRESHSCQADKTANRAARKFAPVACEQPPRSNLVTPDQIGKAVASAIAALG